MGDSEESWPFECGERPAALIDRDAEQTVLTRAATADRRPLYLYGPHGTGKTLLARHAIEAADARATCYVPCRTADTQYKVLQRLHAALTGESISTGYHTAQLQTAVREALEPTAALIVLDDIGFLLANDGDDLLYFLSRLGAADTVRFIAISATHTEPATVLDDRTYSSLRPRQLEIAPYTTATATQILRTRTEALGLDIALTPEALTAIATTTKNIRLGLCWLTLAAEVADAQVTASLVQAIHAGALHRYRRQLLSTFTPHHACLLEAIDQLTADATADASGRVTTGTVYQAYRTRCRAQDRDPLTARRTSDFLTHLELLGLIDVDHFSGGEQGKTRKMRPTPLQEL